DNETVALQNDGSTVHRPGVVANGFRSYDSWTGSYLQVDPMVDSTENTYVYAWSNPVGRTDVLGLESCIEIDGQQVCWNDETIEVHGDAPVIDGGFQWAGPDNPGTCVGCQPPTPPGGNGPKPPGSGCDKAMMSPVRYFFCR